MLQSVFCFQRLLQTMRYYINGHDEIAELYEDFLGQEGFAGMNEGFWMDQMDTHEVVDIVCCMIREEQAGGLSFL